MINSTPKLPSKILKTLRDEAVNYINCDPDHMESELFWDLMDNAVPSNYDDFNDDHLTKQNIFQLDLQIQITEEVLKELNRMREEEVVSELDRLSKLNK